MNPVDKKTTATVSQTSPEQKIVISSEDLTQIVKRVLLQYPEEQRETKKIKLHVEPLEVVESIEIEKPYNIFENLDVMRLIASSLKLKDLFRLSFASTSSRAFVQTVFVDQLNTGKITLSELGLGKLTHIINFLGDTCSKILTVDLTKFSLIEDLDIKTVSEAFKNIEHLFLKNPKLTNDSASFFANMTSLKSLKLECGEKTQDFSFLQNCSQLRSIELIGSKTIKDVNFLQNTPNITSLNLRWCENIEDLNGLKNCKELQILNLWGCKKINDFNIIGFCHKLTSLNLNTCNQLKSISFLKNCLWLTTLDLWECDKIENFSFLGCCPMLRHLNLSGCKQITDLSFLEKCQQLTNLLNLEDCTKITNFSYLAYCKNLKSLKLAGCTQVIDFSFLQFCDSLENLNLSRCIQVNDILFLNQLNHEIKILNLWKCGPIGEVDILALYNKGIKVSR